MNDGNLGLLDSCRSTRLRDDVLVEEDSVDELGVVDGSTDLFDESNISQVDVGGGVGDESEDRVDGDGRDDGGVLRDNLSRRGNSRI